MKINLGRPTNGNPILIDGLLTDIWRHFDCLEKLVDKDGYYSSYIMTELSKIEQFSRDVKKKVKKKA